MLTFSICVVHLSGYTVILKKRDADLVLVQMQERRFRSIVTDGITVTVLLK